MQMTASEIARSYREAKYKDRQIGILTQLNACPREEIVRILQKEGIEPKKIHEDIEQSQKKRRGRNPRKCQTGTETEKEEMQENQGVKRGQKSKNAINIKADGQSGKAEKMLQTALEYFDELEEKIRATSKELEHLTGIRDSCAALIKSMEHTTG